jgi:ribosome-associated heat shock protein Hsp15
VKSRTLAQKLIEAGVVRVNSARTVESDHAVGPGDVLTMTIHTRLLVWRVLAPGARRGPSEEARGLYEDLSPPPLPRPDGQMPPAARDPGTGRPTKKQRRDTDRLQDED